MNQSRALDPVGSTRSDAPPEPGTREAEILAAIRRAFAAKGFDGASMQYLAREAGMSVGNFYRYFPSKAAMVEAMILADLAGIEAEFAMIAAAPAPLEALRAAVHGKITQRDLGCDDPQIWAEITATALRKPEIAAIVARMEGEIAGYLTRAMALSLGIAPEEAARRFASHARALILLVKGNATEAQLGGAASGELTALLLRMTDALIDEIAANLPGPAGAKPPAGLED